MEFEHALGHQIFAVDFLHQIIERFGEWALLRRGFDDLPYGVGYGPKSRVEIRLEILRHYGIERRTQATQT